MSTAISSSCHRNRWWAMIIFSWMISPLKMLNGNSAFPFFLPDTTPAISSACLKQQLERELNNPRGLAGLNNGLRAWWSNCRAARLAEYRAQDAGRAHTRGDGMIKVGMIHRVEGFRPELHAQVFPQLKVFRHA